MPIRLLRWRSRKRKGVAYYGNCPECGHDWREHVGGSFANPPEDGCGECQYEVEHDQRVDNAPVCFRVAEPPPLEQDD